MNRYMCVSTQKHVRVVTKTKKTQSPKDLRSCGKHFDTSGPHLIAKLLWGVPYYMYSILFPKSLLRGNRLHQNRGSDCQLCAGL